MWSQEKILRVAFLVGAFTDALAILPMLVPALARLLWVFYEVSGAYRFAMGYGASLMLGWTALLLWAYQRPLERKGVAALTVLVIIGLVCTEIVAVLAGFYVCLLQGFTIPGLKGGGKGSPDQARHAEARLRERRAPLANEGMINADKKEK